MRGSGLFDSDKPIRKDTKTELHDSVHKERPRQSSTTSSFSTGVRSRASKKSFLSKDLDPLRPHIRTFGERAVTFTACSECGGTRLSESAR